jgi:phage shock protein E
MCGRARVWLRGIGRALVLRVAATRTWLEGRAAKVEQQRLNSEFKTMTWTSLFIVIAVAALLVMLKRRGQISARAAAEYLRKGAMVIDVRSAGEFTAGHLPRAVNIPLSEIETVTARKVKGRDQVLLLHCQSGMRSAQARRKLRALGYTKAWNMGSYARAATIMGIKQGN